MLHSKILPLNQLTQVCNELHLQNKKIIHCHGVFDLLHPGHIRHLNEAKSLGDILVVTLTRDPFVNKGPGRPAFSEQLRAESIAALSAVDFVALNDTATAVEAIYAIRPSFYVKGPDYEDRGDDLTSGILSEETAVKEVGGNIHFTHDITFSSTKLLNDNFSLYPAPARQYINTNRAKLSADFIIDQIKSLKDLRVLLIGDAIVDEYHYCAPLGKSPKETIVATRYISEESFPGGILACANHIASFCDRVQLVTCLGAKDSRQAVIESRLNPNISKQFFFRDGTSTVIKRRYVEPNFLTKMFQVSFLNDTDLPETVGRDIYRYLKEAMPQFDIIVVADYGHGLLTRPLRELICERAPYLALNVQTNSANLGFNLITKYPSAHYISIDEPELRLAMQQKYQDIREVIKELAHRYPKATITITLGHNGSITLPPGKPFVEIPCLSNKVVDRVGAGDAYFAITSLLARRGVEPEVLGLVGNAVGAQAVTVICNRSSTTPVPLYKFIKAILT